MGKKIRSDARQLHERASEEEKKEALELFKKLDLKGDKKIRLSEFEKDVEPADLSSEKVFNELDLDADGCLDFGDFLVLFYYMKNKINILRCDGCHVLLFGARFPCFKCIASSFSSDQDLHPLCRACHAGGKFGHEHHFNQRLPQVIPKLQDDKVEGKKPWNFWGSKDKQENVQLPPQGVGRKYKQANVQLPPQGFGRMYKQANVQQPPQGLGRKDKQANVQPQFQKAPLRGAEVRKDNGKQWNLANLWGGGEDENADNLGQGAFMDNNFRQVPQAWKEQLNIPKFRGGKDEKAKLGWPQKDKKDVKILKLKKDALLNKDKNEVPAAAATSSLTLPSHSSKSSFASLSRSGTNSEAASSSSRSSSKSSFGSSSSRSSSNFSGSSSRSGTNSQAASSSSIYGENPYRRAFGLSSQGKEPKG